MLIVLDNIAVNMDYVETINIEPDEFDETRCEKVETYGWNVALYLAKNRGCSFEIEDIYGESGNKHRGDVAADASAVLIGPYESKEEAGKEFNSIIKAFEDGERTWYKK